MTHLHLDVRVIDILTAVLLTAALSVGLWVVITGPHNGASGGLVSVGLGQMTVVSAIAAMRVRDRERGIQRDREQKLERALLAEHKRIANEQHEAHTEESLHVLRVELEKIREEVRIRNELDARRQMNGHSTIKELDRR